MDKLDGECLKRVRMLRGISQSQLANTLHISNNKIIKVEKDEYNLTDEEYVKWLNALYDDETLKASKRKLNSITEAKALEKKQAKEKK